MYLQKLKPTLPLLALAAIALASGCGGVAQRQPTVEPVSVTLSCAEKGLAQFAKRNPPAKQNDKYRSKEEIRIVLNCEQDYFNEVYGNYVKNGMPKGGKAVFRIIINPDGSVSNVVVVKSNFQNRRFLNDIMVNIAVLDFQKRDVLETSYEYPLKFM